MQDDFSEFKNIDNLIEKDKLEFFDYPPAMMI
jgi:hypothetical protein